MIQGRFYSRSVEDTLDLGGRLAADLKGGMSIALRGDLGLGKTHFAKGIITARTGVEKDDIPSPTFTLIEEYDGNPKIYHVDLYRLEKKSELLELPWDDLMSPNAISLIEWPERIPPEISPCQIEVVFSKAKDSQRVIEIVLKDLL